MMSQYQIFSKRVQVEIVRGQIVIICTLQIQDKEQNMEVLFNHGLTPLLLKNQGQHSIIKVGKQRKVNLEREIVLSTISPVCATYTIV